MCAYFTLEAIGAAVSDACDWLKSKMTLLNGQKAAILLGGAYDLAVIGTSGYALVTGNDVSDKVRSVNFSFMCMSYFLLFQNMNEWMRTPPPPITAPTEIPQTPATAPLYKKIAVSFATVTATATFALSLLNAATNFDPQLWTPLGFAITQFALVFVYYPPKNPQAPLRCSRILDVGALGAGAGFEGLSIAFAVARLSGWKPELEALKRIDRGEVGIANSVAMILYTFHNMVQAGRKPGIVPWQRRAAYAAGVTSLVPFVIMIGRVSGAFNVAEPVVSICEAIPMTWFAAGLLEHLIKRKVREYRGIHTAGEEAAQALLADDHAREVAEQTRKAHEEGMAPPPQSPDAGAAPSVGEMLTLAQPSGTAEDASTEPHPAAAGEIARQVKSGQIPNPLAANDGEGVDSHDSSSSASSARAPLRSPPAEGDTDRVRRRRGGPPLTVGVGPFTTFARRGGAAPARLTPASAPASSPPVQDTHFSPPHSF